MVSHEYVLDQLDQWYVNKIKTGYTPQVASHVAGLLGRALAEREKAGKKPIRLTANDFHMLSVEGVVENAHGFFTQAYATLESITNEFTLTGEDQTDMPPGIYNEYIAPMMEPFKTTQSFVNLVRTQFDAAFPQELCAQDIDKAFTQTYGGHEGFTQFGVALLRAIPVAMHVIAPKSTTPETFNEVQGRVDVLEKPMAYINEQVFG